jgi:hypothetical protein
MVPSAMFSGSDDAAVIDVSHCARVAVLTLRFELLDFVGRYPAPCGSERYLRSFLGEVNQMLDLAGILLSGPDTLGFFESQTGFFQGDRGAPDDFRVLPNSVVGASCALQSRVIHGATA